MLITNPESEPFVHGQPRELYDMPRCPKTLLDFTTQQGADLHCEVNAPGYRDFPHLQLARRIPRLDYSLLLLANN